MVYEGEAIDIVKDHPRCRVAVKVSRGLPDCLPGYLSMLVLTVYYVLDC